MFGFTVQKPPPPQKKKNTQKQKQKQKQKTTQRVAYYTRLHIPVLSAALTRPFLKTFFSLVLI